MEWSFWGTPPNPRACGQLGGHPQTPESLLARAHTPQSPGLRPANPEVAIGDGPGGNTRPGPGHARDEGFRLTGHHARLLIFQGGHLAALTGVSNGNSQLEGAEGEYRNESSAVQGIISFYGAGNLTTILADRQKSNAQAHASLTMRLGGLFDETLGIQPFVVSNGGNGGPDHGTPA